MADAETVTGPQQAYAAGTQRSGRAFASARRRLPTGVSRQTLAYRPYPLFAERGAGQYLWDVDGNRYLDFVNNYTSLIHGHAHGPSVEAAVAELRHGGALGAPTARELEFASLLIERFPVLERLRFALSGSEAITYALRVARAYTGRKRILKFEGGFHGAHDEVQQSIGLPPLPPGTFGPGVPSSAGLMDVPTLVAVFNDTDSVRAAFAAHGDDIAAVVAEPFLGNSGLITAAPGFLAFLREIAHAHGALLLLDEIQSMRLAYGGAQQLHDVTPDLVALGKIMGGGLPLAVLGGSQEIMAALDGFTPEVPQTGTFTAFSAALAAGMATMRLFDRDAIARLNDLGDRTRTGVEGVFRSAGLPVTVNGQGSMFHIIVTSGPVDRYRAWHAAPADLWTAIRLELLARGIYITARGTGCLSTPMDQANIDWFLAELQSVVHKIAYGRDRHVE
jgi:glutamate-1-semialdehyde 2,1-aminomutase